VKFALLFQLEIGRFGFTLAAISELTREVFLPDQSVANTKTSAKAAQELFRGNIVEICARLCMKVCPKRVHYFPPRPEKRSIAAGAKNKATPRRQEFSLRFVLPRLRKEKCGTPAGELEEACLMDRHFARARRLAMQFMFLGESHSRTVFG
jgi:hypothetical protein